MNSLRTKISYLLIGIAASFGLSLLFYWSLLLNSSIKSLIENTKSEPSYLLSYGILTLGTIILFGINVSIFVYRWQKFGLPNIKRQISNGIGALIGVAASACPVCGSTILSLIGITAGLAVFPFAGLELKALSFSLMLLPIYLTKREIKKLDCDKDICMPADDYSIKEKDIKLIQASLALIFSFLLIGLNLAKKDPLFAKFFNKITENSKSEAITQSNKLLEEIASRVLPQEGFQSKIYLGDIVLKLIENGVIDKGKFKLIYQNSQNLTKEIEDILNKPSYNPILLTKNNANYYINFLWPLGLANYMSFNKNSPIFGKSLFNFASTGGWTLGKEDNGGKYFNKFEIIKLTKEQEELVVRVAQNTYRPCCNNSTFFQDCNHGSALLGLLELGASQGLSEEELYRQALAFNSFWFPQNYIKIALYFKIFKNIDWEDVEPKEVLGENYSTISGFFQNIDKPLQKFFEQNPGLLPEKLRGSGCGI